VNRNPNHSSAAGRKGHAAIGRVCSVSRSVSLSRVLKQAFSLPLADARGSVTASESALVFPSCKGAVRSRAGALSIQFLVILVPVLLGFMGFAVDLGRLYLIRGELNQAASAMALAAAAKLNGTIAATDSATAAAQSTLDNGLGDANAYNFGSLLVGQGNALLTSVVQQPAYFQNLSDAVATLGQTGVASGADGTTARHAVINLNADAPLLFWSLLTVGQSRKTNIAAAAIAGISAPVCTACGIEPYAIGPVNASDPVDFGYVSGTMYTFGMTCTGAVPALLPGTTVRVPYLIIDRFNTSLAFTEDQQLFRVGANGLIPSTTPSQSCSIIGTTENIWATATPIACAAATPNASVEDAMCGLSSRLTDPTQITACTTAVSDIADLATGYTADTDSLTETDYTSYTGNNRRVITLPVVDALTTTPATMNVLGFRQFLLEPTTTSTASPQANIPTDGNGRFAALYIGSLVPVKQGSLTEAGLNISCGIQNGPGKVVLHQ
jgi:Flp pilus assembly protein TadG